MISFLGMKLSHPIICAAGPWSATHQQITSLERTGIAAITTKTITLEPRVGHPEPNFIETPYGSLNALGLGNDGAMAMVPKLGEAQRLLSVPLFVSIYGETIKEFVGLARFVDIISPALIELNLSCPNLGKRGLDEATVFLVTSQVKEAVACPISVKLAPNLPNIVDIAVAAESAGADAITAVNTMPAMAISAATGLPILSNVTGGLSGPALKPIALKCVYDIAKRVRIPIIGVGGVSRGADVAEMLFAGATLVGVGTASGRLPQIVDEFREGHYATL